MLLVRPLRPRSSSTPTGAGPTLVSGRTINGSLEKGPNPDTPIIVGGSDNCYDGNEWTSACSGNEDCAENCAVEGAEYETTYGATTDGDALTLSFVTEHEYGTNVGSRFYLMDGSDSYQMFDLIGNEFTFDVDLSTVGCGINSALYFVAMEADGGVASYPVNEAGANFGTGYCDSQCARDLKFIAGQGNFEGWEPSSSDASAGVGNLGACCAEIDVWESNSHSFALTPHACEVGHNEFHVCETDDCGGTYSEDRFAGFCDANGCDYNPYRMGDTDFYGEGKTLDTSQPFTLVTSGILFKITILTNCTVLSPSSRLTTSTSSSSRAERRSRSPLPPGTASLPAPISTLTSATFSSVFSRRTLTVILTLAAGALWRMLLACLWSLSCPSGLT